MLSQTRCTCHARARQRLPIHQTPPSHTCSHHHTTLALTMHSHTASWPCQLRTGRHERKGPPESIAASRQPQRRGFQSALYAPTPLLCCIRLKPCSRSGDMPGAGQQSVVEENSFAHQRAPCCRSLAGCRGSPISRVAARTSRTSLRPRPASLDLFVAAHHPAATRGAMHACLTLPLPIPRVPRAALPPQAKEER